MTNINVRADVNADDRLAVSVNTTARRLSVSPSFVRLEIARGRLHPIRLGRRVLVGEAEIHRYLADNTTSQVLKAQTRPR
jgi:excisionase family DNA binding protein